MVTLNPVGTVTGNPNVGSNIRSPLKQEQISLNLEVFQDKTRE